MSRGILVTGTDTGIGKTSFTLALMEALKHKGLKVAGMKPVASGAKYQQDELFNEDALLIRQACSEPYPYELINPIVFEEAVAPHIAAEKEAKRINMEKVVSAYDRLRSENDMVVVEGIGGWRVPLPEENSLAQLAKRLHLSVVLVVGLRQGCINHALLTYEVICADGINLRGWVSNMLEKDYIYKKETLSLFSRKLSCPKIADLAYMDEFEPEGLHGIIDLSHII